jgi:hypothetical protein
MPNAGLNRMSTLPQTNPPHAPRGGRAEPVWVQLRAATAALLLLACTTATFVIQQYDGPQRPSSTIAVLRILGGGDAYIAALDGEQLGFQLEDRRDRIHVEMLPGRHEISIGQVKDERIVTRAFHALPGRTYRAVILRDQLSRDSYGQPNWSLGVFLVDPDTDQLLNDVAESAELPKPQRVAPRAQPAATVSEPAGSAARATEPASSAASSAAESPPGGSSVASASTSTSAPAPSASASTVPSPMPPSVGEGSVVPNAAVPNAAVPNAPSSSSGALR